MPILPRLILPCIALAAMLIGGCAAQGPTDGGLSRAQADQIMSELKQIKQLLVEQRAATTAPKTAEAKPAAEASTSVAVQASVHDSIGSPNAPVVLIEYMDYQCPFCRRFHERSWPEIKRRYVDTGKVRLEVRDMPLPFHDEAMPAAIAARCAGRQGKFWPVFEALLGNPDAVTAEGPRRAAVSAGIATAPYDQCLADPSIRKAIDADASEGDRIGVTGTPGFVIAQRRGERLEGILILGAQPTNVFTSRFDTLLATHAS